MNSNYSATTMMCVIIGRQMSRLVELAPDYENYKKSNTDTSEH